MAQWQQAATPLPPYPTGTRGVNGVNGVNGSVNPVNGAVNTAVNAHLPEVAVDEPLTAVNPVITVNSSVNEATDTAEAEPINEYAARYIPSERWGELPLMGSIPLWAKPIMAQMLKDGVSKTRICTAFYRGVGRHYMQYVKPFLDQIEGDARAGQGGGQ
jgi:hypothetical protein